MVAIEQFDALIVGAGQAGGPLSGALGAAGWKTAIIEREHAGGTCVNVGCTPTKTMIASARIAHLVARASDFGVESHQSTVDLEKVRERKQQIVEAFRSGSQSGIESVENVELIFGEASFSSPSTMSIRLQGGDERILEASTIVLNAGGRPRMPDVPGLVAAAPLDSTSIMELDEVPERLLIVGGGPIGLEFGQMFQRFGSTVTLLERGSRLLAREDEDVAAAIEEILRDDGVRFVFDANLRAVQSAEGHKRAVVESTGETLEIRFDEILVAAGRVPNSDLLNLPAAGVEIDARGYIMVNDALETNVDGIYAVGDINGGPAFTHIAYDDFRVLRDNLLHGAGRTRVGRPVPYTIFVDPALGRIGMTEEEAKQQELDILVFKLPMQHVARALEVDETRGFMKAVVDRPAGQIVGASFLGIEGGEIAGAIQLAMMGGLHYTDIRDGVFSHPTLLESLNSLFSAPVSG